MYRWFDVLMYVIGLTLSMLCGSILRIDVHEPWSETVVATFRRPNCVQTRSRNKQHSTLDGYYIYIRIYIHIHLHVHMSAQVSLIVMRIHRLTMVTPWLYETIAQLYWVYLCRCTPWRTRTRTAIGKWRRLVCISQIQAAAFYSLLLLPTRRIRVCRQH